ncbi:cell division protein SepF [Nesterenkonia sp. LB17]|uniref:cell division protein SepF n=1 Tax=unclassified Nesterenkonia TaxID=2629769 RepID=UPI001F4C8413|nr:MULTISPECIES: cell division protein SepF [unclassified Nesterenkonia]MCH8559521.1 cell division protein SepF [Nesterenkonia sp. DZ6]MCH8561698.1 cell division protein SepF [Nesterenkonia sp. YGD6]MCH8564787.1 cell division protein SepF [Nesterenkonia sp. LB17]MCH8570403.1 cell division protein SepF [Nesterenkonia sp. AY15]
MAGAFKKTMIYLGLADGDDYSEDSFSKEPSSTTRSPQGSASEPSSVSRSSSMAASVRETPAPTSATSSARGNEVVSLGIDHADDSSHTGQYNSSNLAVDPDYRAPVTPIKRAPSSRDESSPMRKITTVHPRSYNDAKVIGESFRDNIPVIMNVTDMGEAEAKRLVDFSAGLVFGMGGSIERVTNKVFLLTPKNIEVLAEERAAAETPSSAQFFNQS